MDLIELVRNKVLALVTKDGAAATCSVAVETSPITMRIPYNSHRITLKCYNVAYKYD